MPVYGKRKCGCVIYKTFTVLCDKHGRIARSDLKVIK